MQSKIFDELIIEQLISQCAKTYNGFLVRKIRQDKVIWYFNYNIICTFDGNPYCSFFRFLENYADSNAIVKGGFNIYKLNNL